MTSLTGRQALPDQLDWIDSPVGAPGSPASFRIEDYVLGDHYVLRADIPGVDPDRDIDIEVTADLLTVRAHRREESVSRRHQEIRYGELSRTLRLPAGSRTAELTATYDAGVLQVTVPVSDVPVARTAPVTPPSEKDR